MSPSKRSAFTWECKCYLLAERQTYGNNLRSSFAVLLLHCFDLRLVAQGFVTESYVDTSAFHNPFYMHGGMRLVRLECMRGPFWMRF